MFNKLRYAYHLTVCERMIIKFKNIDHTTYELTKRFKWHRDRLQDLMIAINKKSL